MIDIYFIRHAECEVNLTRDIVGGQSTGSPLTSYGIRQAKALGKKFKKKKIYFDGAFVSNAVRTIDTAKYALKYSITGAKFIPQWKEIAELDQGDWEGKLRKECYTDEIMQEIVDGCDTFTPPNGESQFMVSNRMEQFVKDRIIEPYDDNYDDNPSRVAVISHGIAIKCFLRRIMNFDSGFVYYTHLYNCSITRVQYDKGQWTVKCVGSSDLAIK